MNKIFFVILCFIFCIKSQGQNWENPADRYLDEYKKYEDAICPIITDSIKYFVYFSRDRSLILDHPFLTHSKFLGAQIMYSWKDLEPQKGMYDFSKIEQDIVYLERYGKKLFIQLQDVTFYPQNKAVPNYLLSDKYGGGAVMQFSDNGKPEGWVAKRWNENVRDRFALLLMELGKKLDSKIEGINLQETAIGVNKKIDDSFSEEKYVIGLKANMLALKKHFPLP